MKKTITQIILAYLKANDLKQTTLADYCGESPQNLYRILRRKTIDAEMLLKISTFCNHDFLSDLKAQEDGSAPLMVNESRVTYQTANKQNEIEFLLRENIELYRKLEKCRELSGIEVKKAFKPV